MSFGLLPFRPLLHVTVNEEIVEDTQNQQHAAAPQSDTVNLAGHQLLILSGLDPDPAENRAPKRRADERVKGVKFEIHFYDAGGYADQVANHRQESGDENPPRPETFRPTFGAVDLFRRNKEISAVTQNEWTPRQPRNPIHNGCAYPRANGTGNCNSRQAQMNLSFVSQMGGGRNDQFTR